MKTDEDILGALWKTTRLYREIIISNRSHSVVVRMYVSVERLEKINANVNFSNQRRLVKVAFTSEFYRKGYAEEILSTTKGAPTCFVCLTILRSFFKQHVKNDRRHCPKRSRKRITKRNNSASVELEALGHVFWSKKQHRSILTSSGAATTRCAAVCYSKLPVLR